MDNPDALQLDAASVLLNTPPDTLRQQCFRGQIAGVKVPEKPGSKKKVWAIPQWELKRLLEKKTTQTQYETLHSEWIFNMRKGIGYKRPLSQKTIDANMYGLEKFWLFIENPPTEIKPGKLKDQPRLTPTRKPNMKDITQECLELSIANIPIEHDIENCHFSMRDQMYKGFRSFFKFLIRKGLKNRIDFINLEDVKPERIYTEKRPVLTEGQLQNLIHENDNLIGGRLKHKADFDACFSKVCLVLAGLTGLRLDEIINLRLDEVQFNQQEMTFIGKGRKRRRIGIGPDTYQVLKEWEVYRPSSKHPNLLLQIDGEPASRHIIYRRIRRLGDRIGVRANPHALRRTSSSIALERGIALHHISKNLGHTRVSTTEKSYISINEQKSVNAFKGLTLRRTDTLVETSKSNTKSKEDKAAILLALLEKADLL